MKKFRVNARATISIYTDVFAEDENDALEKASEVPVMDIITDGGTCPSEFWVADSLDGEPMGLEIEE